MERYTFYEKKVYLFGSKGIPFHCERYTLCSQDVYLSLTVALSLPSGLLILVCLSLEQWQITLPNNHTSNHNLSVGVYAVKL